MARRVPGRIRGALIATTALVIAIVSTVPGSLALWNHSAEIADYTVRAGMLNAAIAPGTVQPVADTTAALGTLDGMLPTESRGATFTVRNTGNVNLALAASLDGTTAANTMLGFGLSPGECTTPLAGGAALSSTPIAVGDRIPPNTNASFCLRVTLIDPPDARQGADVGGYTILLSIASVQS